MGLVTNNPLLSNITDYLIEEASAEEEELLGKNNDLEEGEEGEDGNTIVRDEELVKVLVRLGGVYKPKLHFRSNLICTPYCDWLMFVF